MVHIFVLCASENFGKLFPLLSFSFLSLSAFWPILKHNNQFTSWVICLDNAKALFSETISPFLTHIVTLTLWNFSHSYNKVIKMKLSIQNCTQYAEKWTWALNVICHCWISADQDPAPLPTSLLYFLHIGGCSCSENSWLTNMHIYAWICILVIYFEVEELCFQPHDPVGSPPSSFSHCGFVS